MTLRAVALLLAALLFVPAARGADAYPLRALTMIVPFAPGGGTDIMARMVADKLSRALDKPVVVDNRPGAGGTIGTELAARAEPNGYTVMMGSVSTISINPSLYTRWAINPLKDLVPIGVFAITPSVLVVSNSLPVHSVQELLAYARANPGKLNFGSAGAGTSHHLSGQLLNMQAGIDAQHVPYNGSAPALLGLIRGDVHFLIANMPSLKPAIDAKQIRALAVTSLERSALNPEYPTVAESGLPGFEVVVWYGLFAPAGTPQPIIDRLNAELGKIAGLPEVKEKLAGEGANPASSSVSDFNARIRADYEKWRKVIQASGTRLD